VLVTERDIAETFDGGAYENAYEIVEQYRKATRYASKHNVKSGATASALDLPRGRLRTWIDEGGAPDSVNCIETARVNGWLNVTYSDDVFAGLNALVANVFSGGSINQKHHLPLFALNSRGEDSHVIDALNIANVEYTIEERGPNRADEVRPVNGTTLGRVLVSLGAPVGPKAQQRLELPAYLEGAPEKVQRLFVVCYLENRGQQRESVVTFREERSQQYLESLAALISDVANASVQVSEKNVVLSKAATVNLGAVV